jgi:D-alanine-D-alanine ligase
VTSQPEASDPAPITAQAIATARQLLAGSTVCLLAREQPSPIEAAELAGFAQTLPGCGVTVTAIRFADVHELYRPAAIQALGAAAVVVKFTHGPLNRSGLVPAVLDTLSARRAGHPPSVDILSQRKSLVKELMRREQVPTLDYLLLDGGVPVGAQVAQLAARTGATAFVVKPDDGNASEGLHWAGSVEDAARIVHDSGGQLMVEPYRGGRIITVGAVTLLGQVRTVAPLEYLLDGDLVMDADWKRNPKRAPARLEPSVDAEVRTYAARVHRAVGARGLSRTDFIVGPDGVTALEINTNIGLGPGHDIAAAFDATGLDYDDLVICQTASGLPLPGQR